MEVLIDELLIKLSLLELVDTYYKVRWTVEERQEHLQPPTYKNYLKRINAELVRRENILKGVRV